MAVAAARVAWICIGAIVIVMPLLPIPQWIGGADPGPAWAPYLSTWSLGALVVATSAGLTGWLLRDRRLPALRLRVSARWIVVFLTVGFTAGAVLVMRGVFAGNPHLVDEMAHLFHAQVFADGRLAAPAPEPPAAFLLLQTMVRDGVWISQYPPGHTALLAIGSVFEAEWMVNPLLGGLSVIFMFILARGLYGPITGLLASFLWAASGWVLVMSGTYMSHVSAVALSLGAWAAVFGPRCPRPIHWIAAGLALAAVAATRPLDAIVAALPIVCWIAVRRRPVAAGWLMIGSAPVLLLLAWFNWQLFGSATTFGYSAMYGAEHGLGFHVDPYGNPYTPLVALSNAAVALRRLHIYLYEWPVPALLVVAVWGVVARRRPGDLYVAAGVLAAPILYAFYWHSGFLYGPRFYYPAVPFLVIALARGFRWLWSLARRTPLRRVNLPVVASTSVLVVLGWGWADLLPTRLDAYRRQLPTLKLHPERALADAGIQQALVIVPESWSARMIAGYWGEGVQPGLTERAFRRLDTCDLHQALVETRRRHGGGRMLTATIEDQLARGSPPVPLANGTPDPWIRLRPRDQLPDDCQRELARDLDGFTLFGNLGWRNRIGLDSGIVFARDLYERNTMLFDRYPGWEVWRWAPPTGQPDATPVLVRLSSGNSGSE